MESMGQDFVQIFEQITDAIGRIDGLFDTQAQQLKDSDQRYREAAESAMVAERKLAEAETKNSQLQFELAEARSLYAGAIENLAQTEAEKQAARDAAVAAADASEQAKAALQATLERLQSLESEHQNAMLTAEERDQQQEQERQDVLGSLKAVQDALSGIGVAEGAGYPAQG